jgi:hypothetical protein
MEVGKKEKAEEDKGPHSVKEGIWDNPGISLGGGLPRVNTKMLPVIS